MIKPAFSTVACPEWTLDRVFGAAAEHGFKGVELRSFGFGSSRFACDPALTSTEKVRQLSASAGVGIATLATGISFEAPIRPPVIGRVISDTERPQREGKRMVDLAAAIEAPFVRVFGFRLPEREKRSSALARVLERLAVVLDAARNTGVRVVLENGGSFPTAVDLAEVIELAANPLLGAAYSLPVALAAGEDPANAVSLLGDRLWTVKLKDSRDGDPCPLGTGDLPCRAFVELLARSGFDGWVVYEWDRAWLPDLAPPEQVLPEAARRLYEWAGAGAAARRVPASA